MGRSAARQRATRRGSAALVVGALGVVYGDIGTSPLYAFRVALGDPHPVEVDEASVLGLLSLIVWALVLIISVKYLLIILRADNDGEGGILALTALLPRKAWGRSGALFLMGLFGAGLLYGDGMITPAISVLSAAEGVEVAAPASHRLVVPLAVGVLVALFAVQRRGTGALGAAFGPAMVVWFGVLALLGAQQIAREPSVLRALDPMWGGRFLLDSGTTGFLVLGAIFLVVTGGEALYADLGHFGRRPIRMGWFGLVLPALVLNYFGQGALVLRTPAAAENPFYLLAPEWGRWPLTALAIAATVIASQALISGAFSLTAQAVRMDLLPRVLIRHTSEARGQVYVPLVNWSLLAACATLVLVFRSSTGLAAAYGLAVSLTMLLTTILAYVILQRRLGWGRPATAAVMAVFATAEVAFVAANAEKFGHGGWIPLAVAMALFITITAWRGGQRRAALLLRREAPLQERLVAGLARSDLPRVAGTAVYLTRDPAHAPPALIANTRHFDVLHERIVFLTVTTALTPRVPPAARAHIEDLGAGFLRVELSYGFLDQTDVPGDLEHLVDIGVSFDRAHTLYFVGRRTFEIGAASWPVRWRNHLYVTLHRNAQDAAGHLRLPADRTVDVGIHVVL